MSKSKLVRPHGGGELKPLMLSGAALAEEKKRAETLKKINISSRETGDLLMMGCARSHHLKVS